MSKIQLKYSWMQQKKNRILKRFLLSSTWGNRCLFLGQAFLVKTHGELVKWWYAFVKNLMPSMPTALNTLSWILLASAKLYALEENQMILGYLVFNEKNLDLSWRFKAKYFPHSEYISNKITQKVILNKREKKLYLKWYSQFSQTLWVSNLTLFHSLFYNVSKFNSRWKEKKI